MLTEGAVAPDFVLPGTDGGEIGRYALADLVSEGSVVLAFFPFDFSPTTTAEVCAFRDLGWFTFGPEVFGVALSTDSAFSHRAFAREHDLDFPLLSDDTGTVSDTYGVLQQDVMGHGFASRRAVFVVDTDWTVRYAWAADDLEELPDWDRVEAALERV